MARGAEGFNWGWFVGQGPGSAPLGVERSLRMSFARNKAVYIPARRHKSLVRCSCPFSHPSDNIYQTSLFVSISSDYKHSGLVANFRLSDKGISTKTF